MTRYHDLIENPYTPRKKLRADGMISDQFWNALIARMIEIGADDLDELPDEEGDDEKPKAATPRRRTRKRASTSSKAA